MPRSSRVRMSPGIKIREMFEEGATEALRDGRSSSERFELPNVRVTIEVVEPGPPASVSRLPQG